MLRSGTNRGRHEPRRLCGKVRRACTFGRNTQAARGQRHVPGIGRARAFQTQVLDISEPRADPGELARGPAKGMKTSSVKY